MIRLQLFGEPPAAPSPGEHASTSLLKNGPAHPGGPGPTQRYHTLPVCAPPREAKFCYHMDPQIQDHLVKNEVIGDVIDDFIPKFDLKVTYGGVRINFGTELTPAQTAVVPDVSWLPEPGAHYTLAMVDPDAPSRANPKFRNWKHWIVGNIKGNDVASGVEVSAYRGPSPPRGTGLHRYCFVLFEQAGPLPYKHEPEDNPMDRAKFDLRAWCVANKAGKVVACNFFQAKHQ